MNNVIGYIEHVDSENFFERLLEKFFCKIVFEKYSFDKYIIMVNSMELKEKELGKLVHKIKQRGINQVVLSNDFTNQKDIFIDHGIHILDGKYLMRNLLKDIILYIFQDKDVDISKEPLYVTIDDDSNSEIIMDVANLFKSLNIVTCKLKKLKRLDKKLEENSELVYSITNNLKKSLKRARIIVNFDYDEKFFSEARLNREAIIINLCSKKIVLKNTFKGLIIENVDILYRQNCIEMETFNNYNKAEVLESNIYGKSYNNVTELCRIFDCKITNLVGKNGKISGAEIKNILS